MGNIIFASVVIIIVFVILCFWIVSGSTNKERKWTLFKTFKRKIYHFKTKHRCLFCKKYKGPLSLIDLHDPTYEIPSHIPHGFHLKCIEDCLHEPEKYSTDLRKLSIAVHVVETLQERAESSRREEEKYRSLIADKINQIKHLNLEFFLDQATGRINLK